MSTKTSTARQKVRLLVALASLNNDHISDLRALLCGCEVLVQAQLGPRQALTPSQHSLAILARCKLKQHRIGVRACRRGEGPRSHKPLPHGDDDLGAQPHLTLQQLCVESLHQFLFGLALLNLEAHDAQVQLALPLFGCIS